MSCSVLSDCDPVDHSPSGSSVHGTSQARILEWVAISDQKHASCVSSISRGFFFFFNTTEPPGKLESPLEGIKQEAGR